jgi:site-specific DNA-adenine methylase
MTCYHGGKQRIGRLIAERIMEYVEMFESQKGGEFQGYLEPFCGMLGVFRHVYERLSSSESRRGPNFSFIASDVNRSLILMWKSLQKGWSPPNKCSRKSYEKLRGNGKSSALKGFIGHACSFRCIYFITFDERVKQLEASRRKVMEIAQELKRVSFVHSDFKHWSGVKRFILYLDPPYFLFSNYPNEFNRARKFDYQGFYAWAEKMAENNLVFISEKAILPYTLIEEFKGGEKLYLIN